MQITMNILIDYLNGQGIATNLHGDTGHQVRDVRWYYDNCAFRNHYLYFFHADKPLQFPAGGICAVVSEKVQIAEVPGNCAVLSCSGDEEMLFATIQECFAVYNNWQEQLNNCLATDKSLQRILWISHSIFSNPLVIDDLSFRILAISDEYEISRFKDAEWRFMTKNGYHSSEYVDHLLDSPVLKNNGNSAQEPVIYQFPFLAHSSIYSPICSENEIVGFFTVVSLISPLTQGMVDLSLYLSKILSKVIVDKNKEVSHDFPDDNMLRDILRGKITDKDILRVAFSRAKLTVGDQHCVAILTSNNQSSSNKFLLLRMNDQVFGRLNRCHMLFDKNRIVLIINETCNKLTGKDIANMSEKLLRFNNLSLGLSLPFTDLTDIHLFYRQAETALKFRSLVSEDDCIVFYEKVLGYDLLSRFGSMHERNALCHNAISILSEHDRKKRTDLLATLRTLLKYRNDTGAAANELFLHRNSLYYRIKQIVRLTEVDLDDEQIREHLLVSLRIHDISIMEDIKTSETNPKI